MTSDGEALFRAVCENPADDTPRLVYADWLEENGRTERAEFVRLQCEAWNLCPAYPSTTAARNRASQLLREFGEQWHAELPTVPRLVWSDLFVRGFVDAAWIHGDSDSDARRRGRWFRVGVAQVTRLLDRAFAATPLQRLTAHWFTPEQVEELLAHPSLGRLARLRIPGVAEEQERLLEDARVRFPQTTIY